MVDRHNKLFYKANMLFKLSFAKCVFCSIFIFIEKLQDSFWISVFIL